MRERFESLEELFRSSHILRINTTPFMSSCKEKLPPRFILFESLKSIYLDNVTSHWRNFINFIPLEGVDKELFPCIFPLALGEALGNWYHSIDSQKISTYKKYNKRSFIPIHIKYWITSLHLGPWTFQTRREKGFLDYLAWCRAKVASVINRPIGGKKSAWSLRTCKLLSPAHKVPSS